MSSKYELPTFLVRSTPVELITELLDYQVHGNTVELSCAAARYEPELHNYYGTTCETVFQPAQPAESAVVRLDFCTDAILRLRYFPGLSVPDVHTPMVVGDFAEPITLAVTENETSVTVETACLRVVIAREPWQLEIWDHSDRLVWSTKPVDLTALRRPERQWNPPQERWLFVHRHAYPLGVARKGLQETVFATFDLRHDEHIYGFGEGFGPFDKRGTDQQLWLQECFSNASPASYKRVPFYMSTRGYGLFVNTSNAVNFHVGDLEHTAISVTVNDTALLDCYFIYGPSIKEILPRYTTITGRPAVPPKWSFGLWMSRISYNSQLQVETVARELREHRIPCDVIHIDTDWYAREWECDLRFSRQKFPDPAGMLARLREQGFRTSLWQWPNMVVGSSMFNEGREKGYLAKRANGQTYVYPGFEDDAGLIDYSNPEAVLWVQEKIRALFKLGVAAIKTDFGEGAPPDATYSDVASESMHNLYPLLYNQALFEVTEEVWGSGQGIVWSRSAWAGSQRYPVHWSGDGIARYEDLACVLRAALSFGLSGFPFYAHDIGGFSGLPSPELYARWAQFGLFCSHARCHGAPPREPWAYGERAEAIFRKYDELRYRLMPYIYSEAVQCGQSSLPMVRPLVLEYQDDPTTYTIADQYLFGRSLLVAPILDERNRRQVYLPHGVWVDYWSKQVIEGGQWIDVEALLEVLPLYVRAGAIIPYGPLTQHTGEHRYDPLTVEIYTPAAEGTYTIHDEDHVDIPIRYHVEPGTLTVEVGAVPGQVELVVHGFNVARATKGEKLLPIQPTANGGVLAHFEGTAPQVAIFEAEGDTT